MKIDGKRVRLSRVTADDLDFICQLETNTDIWLFEEQVESDREQVRNKYLEQMNSTSQYDFVITNKVDGKANPVGLAQIWSCSEYRKSWELGFAIIPEFQGQGYGYDAVKQLLDFSFHHLRAHKVVGMCNSHNVKSMSLMERLGMRREGNFKEELLWNNQWVDQYFYSILDTEYIKKSKHI
ncbi:GNAT family N-acetyltransferase [Paenibacillus alvei]|uniref:N-acetyltransferase GCN5 n=1 Tax=Paenibacillus alvei TaxID=44250 RepID=A0A383R9K5_PAEAL|nr:GNAT family protein [Paenibacillus alvei]SYX83847.1 N-acetyltransferase GCN5 [Paenibacillus alvei]